MATEANKNTSENGAESPTTAQPLDMDDDDTQDVSLLAEDNKASTASTTTTPKKDAKETTAIPKTDTLPSQGVPAVTEVDAEAETEEKPPPAPPKPPRPLTEAQKNVMILKEAFPAVEDSVIKAVLSASGSRVEPAFNALLEMTDPDAVENEPPPPPQPPRPSQQQQMSQMEADEQYARQLAQHYDNVGAYEQRTSSRQYAGRPPRHVEQAMGADERERSFIDDDLPVIRDNLRKGFQETQTKVNGWINQLKKRIEENFDESGNSSEAQMGSPRRQAGSSRPSGDYDADPQLLGDDFAGMRLSADGTQANRTMLNQGAFPPRSSSASRPSDGRRVAFQEDTEEINMYDRSPKVPPKDTAPTSVSKVSKWQPLSTVDPNPVTDNDPFSLGDSDDEKEAKEKPKNAKDSASLDDNERLKKDTAEAMAASLVDTPETGEADAKKY